MVNRPARHLLALSDFSSDQQGVEAANASEYLRLSCESIIVKLRDSFLDFVRKGEFLTGLAWLGVHFVRAGFNRVLSLGSTEDPLGYLDVSDDYFSGQEGEVRQPFLYVVDEGDTNNDGPFDDLPPAALR